jgi:hypothetical protein
VRLRETKQVVAKTRRFLGTLNTPAVVIVVLIVVVTVNGFLFFSYHSPGVPPAEVVAAAGDIADCSSEGDEATARLVDGIDGGTILTLGDNGMERLSTKEFAECYDPTWGKFKERTRPIPGNHDFRPQKESPATSTRGGAKDAQRERVAS